MQNYVGGQRVQSLIFAVLLLVVGLLALAPRLEENYYPSIEVEVHDAESTFSLNFLFHGLPGVERCEALTGKISRLVLATCHGACRIKQLRCLTDLDENQTRYLSDAPLGEPSGWMSNGVIVFSARSPALALATCMTSEERSKKSPQPITCIPPNTARPSVSSWDTYFGNLPAYRLSLGLMAVFAGLGFLYQCITGASAIVRASVLVQQISLKLLKFSRLQKQAMLALTDVLGVLSALWLSFSLRFEMLYFPQGPILWLFALAPVLAIPVFIRFGLYRAIIRFLGGQALWAVLMSVLTYCVLFGMLIILSEIDGVPDSVLVINFVLTLFLVGAPRFVAREWLGRSHMLNQHSDQAQRKSVLIYGAGSAGMQLSAALAHSREMRPVGFIDDDESITGHQINGLRIYSIVDLDRVIDTLGVVEVLLAIPSASRQSRNEILSRLEPLPVHVRTLPGVSELAQGKVQVEDLREVDIEDLLGRDAVPPNPALLGATVTGKTVMVTGAGGSIGAELCRQIIRLEPVALVLFENSEYALYAIEQELLRSASRVLIYPILGSVVDQPRVEQALRAYAVQTVFHAAAYKHVPMVEKNPAQGVINNIFGTWRAAEAAQKQGVEAFVLISTDKAVRPTNTMGTTKRFAEMILQSLHDRFPEKTRFTMVRFGNVLGSSGSVVPLFREQIRQGGPVTVTDPRIIRYFMTIPEAAQLVIQAGAMGKGRDVFVLDMGEPVKILDLAKRMIHLSGMTEKTEDNPHGEIEIVFSGLRPGEKLYEELLIGDNVSSTEHARILSANEKMLPWEALHGFLDQLGAACQTGDSERVRQLLMTAVEEFKPQCGNMDLVRGNLIPVGPGATPPLSTQPAQ